MCRTVTSNSGIPYLSIYSHQIHGSLKICSKSIMYLEYVIPCIESHVKFSSLTNIFQFYVRILYLQFVNCESYRFIDTSLLHIFGYLILWKSTFHQIRHFDIPLISKKRTWIRSKTFLIFRPQSLEFILLQ